MDTLLQRMSAERAQRYEAARVAARERLRQALTEFLPAGSEVWVFGSVLRPGHFRDDSDLDVAVERLPPQISAGWLQFQLALRTDRSVDVVDLGESRLRDRIKREGEKWTL